MKINFKRLFAVLTLIFLFVSIFGIVLHESSPQSKHCCLECYAECTVCALKGTLSRAILFVTVASAITVNIKAVKEKTDSVAYVPAARSFPMLC